MKRIVLQPAYILHRRPFRNASLLLEVLSRDHGRVGLVARTSSRPGHSATLSPFQPVLVSWNQRGELGTLTACEAGEGFTVLQGRDLMVALYVNELMLKMLPREVPEPEVFDLYAGFCARLGVDSVLQEEALRLFEKRLLECLGYALPLTADCHGRPLAPDMRYVFSADTGLTPAPEAGDGSKTVSGQAMLNLARETLPDETSRDEAKQVLRLALARQLGGKALKIRDCFSRQY